MVVVVPVVVVVVVLLLLVVAVVVVVVRNRNSEKDATRTLPLDSLFSTVWSVRGSFYKSLKRNT